MISKFYSSPNMYDIHVYGQSCLKSVCIMRVRVEDVHVRVGGKSLFCVAAAIDSSCAFVKHAASSDDGILAPGRANPQLQISAYPCASRDC